MADIGLTETSASSAELVSSIILDTLKQESFLMGTLFDKSSEAVKGAASLDVVRRDTFAAADKAENVALTTQVLTFAKDTLAFDKHKAIGWFIEKIAELQASVNVTAEGIVEASKELALQLDKDLYAQLKLASAAAPDHRIAYVGSSIAQTDILEARKLLNVANVPANDRYLLISPASEKAMLAIADFVRADAYGSANGLINGELGRIYGMKVLMSNVAEDAGSIVYHKTAVAFALQQAPDYNAMYNVQKVGTDHAMDWIYGVKVLDSGKRQVLLGSAT